MWIIVVIVFSAVRPDNFPTTSNFTTLFASQVPLGIVSLGLLVPLVAGDYDLSVASVLTLSGMIVAVLNVQHHWNVWDAAVAAIAIGAFIGLVNGVICVFADIDPFIVTLGTGTFVAGVVLWISNSTAVSGVSSSLVDAVVVNRLGGLSLEFFYLIILTIIIWYILDFTPPGRRALMVGKGREVARLSGLRVRRIRILSFVAAGLLSGLGGVILTGTSGAADPTAGTTLLLPAFAAVFLGSTILYPGRFNPWGTLVAVYFLTTGINGLALLGVSTFIQQLFYGGALVIAVLLSSLAGRRRRPPRRAPLAPSDMPWVPAIGGPAGDVAPTGSGGTVEHQSETGHDEEEQAEIADGGSSDVSFQRKDANQ
ncbi:MAG: ABC transporter permease [Streptosporangiaceae bacterium]